MRTPRVRTWVGVSAAILLGGVLLSGFGAHLVARTETERSRRSFELTGEQLASTLKVAVRHEENLLAGASAVVKSKPNLTSADMERWISLARVRERYPEIQFLGLIVRIPRSELATFSAAATLGVPGPDDPSAVLPPGERPFYCLIQASMAALPVAISATDYCAGEAGTVPRSIRDTGVGSYLPYTVGTETWFLVQVPVYQHAAPVGTVAERRAAFLGWYVTSVDLEMILGDALAGYRDVTLSMDHRTEDSQASFRSGPVPHDAETYAVGLDNGWTATVHRAPVASGILDHSYALLLLVGGVILSVALAGLIMQQGLGRARAEFHARHDSLSGLANRALISVRAEQLVARGRRSGTTGAALYLDIDGFKAVNDSFGHETGNRLLSAVSARLTSAVRQADTIGRVGGDEFVILLDGSSSDAVPEVVAQRLLDILREPFDLDGATCIQVSASIGVAVGDRPSGTELIEDADIAMYAAKRAGGDRYDLFQSELQPGSSDLSAV